MTRNILKKNKVVLCAPTKLLATMAFILEPLIHWSKKNKVELIASSRINPPMGKYENITIRYFRDARLPSLFNVVLLLIELFASIRRNKPTVVVGTNEAGIIAVAVVSFFYKECIYVCLHDEIRTVQDRRGIVALGYGSMMVSLLKAAVKRFSIHCSQDKWRSKLTARMYDIDDSRFINIPNTNASGSHPPAPFFLYDLLNIDREKKILLWIGRLKPRGFLQKLAAALDLLDGEYILVIHARDESFSNEITRVLPGIEQNEKVILSTKSVPYQDINRLVQSAHIGFCAFETDNANSRWIGHSSGKLNRFLQMGVPCIVTKQSGLRWVEKNMLGLSAESDVEIAQAVRALGSARNYYSESARQYFEENLNIDDSLRCLDHAIEQQRHLG